MAKYGIVAGERATPLIKNEVLKDFTDIEITYTPMTMGGMIEDLSSSGGLILQDLKAVLIIDYAFETSDSQKNAEEFVAIQDLMHTNNLSNVTLYLITRDSDLYEKLKGTVAGIPGTYFESVQIFIIKDDYRPSLLKSVLQGERDNQGLFNKEVYNKKSKEQRLREETEREIERRRNLSAEYIEFDKSDPVSVLSQKDYLDTAQRKQADEEKRKQEEKKARERERLEKRNGKRGEIVTKEDISPKPNIEVTIQNQSQAAKPSISNLPSDLIGLREVFQNVKDAHTGVSIGKLETDKGIISIVSDSNAGGSGVVANLADVYAISRRDVLIIDLDIINRSQTLYFNQYDKSVNNQQGSSDSLIEVIQGYDIKNSVVPVSKRVDILSISRNDEVEYSWADAVSWGLENVLIEAREMYDIVILDIPFRLFPKYLNALEEVNRNVFVVENKFYKVQTFFENKLHPLLLEHEEEMESFIKKSNMILNKFRRGSRDEEGNEVNHRYLRDVLDDVGYPYDRIGVAGEIPFYDEWEEQYFTGVRHVWRDSLVLGVYKRVFGKVVI